MTPRKRVVVTGMGAVSSIGTGLEEITRSLREGRSGITRASDWEEYGLASLVAGFPEERPDSPILDRKISKTSGSCSQMALRAACDALEMAGLDPVALAGERIAVLVGGGTGSTRDNFVACDIVNRKRSTRRVSPFTVPRVMGSTAAANLCVALGLRGESWTVSSACSSGSHALGLARMLIQAGRYEMVLAGAAEELNWTNASAFDAMHAISRAFNDTPERASRPFDAHRDGFVMSGGAGVLILEELDAARRRGVTILGELAGFGANSDGKDMVAPWPEGASAVMREALEDAGLEPGDVDYVNAHGTSTPQGDPSEAQAMGEVFGDDQPWISSTKSITGHGIGAAGTLEAIYTLQMLREGFLSPSRNIDELDPSCEHLRLVGDADMGHRPRVALSNSFGFGGTNASLVLRAWGDDS